jgi:hypothetical protein
VPKSGSGSKRAVAALVELENAPIAQVGCVPEQTPPQPLKNELLFGDADSVAELRNWKYLA